MKACRQLLFRIAVPLLVGSCLLWIGLANSLHAAQAPPKPAEKAPSIQASPDADEQAALNDAFQSAQNNPQVILKNLQAFLDRFPHSSRREAVLRTICSYALAANAPGVIVQYGQMLLVITPDDPKLLNLLIDALTRQNDQASRTLAIDYTSRLIRIAEAARDGAALAGGEEDASEQWTERIASTYEKLAGLFRDSGDIDKATGNYEKSYETYATARVAERMGDIALIRGDSNRAMDYYLTAFAFPEKGTDPVLRQEVRRKLGSLYVAEHHSEQGLGDLILSRYDALMPQLAGRYSGNQPQNAGIQDPFKFVLERTDGTALPMADFHGKVLVVDFWATWCGPCRLQGKLVDEVALRFRADPNVVFLSLNMDQDRSGVPAFLKQSGWTVPAAYAQGMDQLLGVRELPTLVMFDRQDRIVFREDGLDPNTFAAELSRRVNETLQHTVGSKQ
jgi:thiol-disulfide isomerase/thioredoxin/tetratricopeptide (TPR) repeat protein